MRTDGTPIFFKHPALQSCFMFIGEAFCLIPYFILRWRKAGRSDKPKRPMPRGYYVRRTLAFAIPALCDATATTLLNVGLFYT